MTRRTCSDWALVAAAVGLLAFILLSPTGSFVHRPYQANAGDAPRVAESETPGPMAGLSPAPLE